MARPRLTLLTLPLGDDADAQRASLSEACAAGDVAAIVLALAPGDERALVNRVKALAPDLQTTGAAVLVASDDATVDLVAVASRGGADGVHVDAGGEAGRARLVTLRERLREGRILGAGRLRSRDDAMNAGEAGVDYLMFGDPRPDGSRPPPDAVAERAAWWAEIFETPCVAVSGGVDDVAALTATGAEFVGLVLGADPAGEVRAASGALAAPARETA